MIDRHQSAQGHSLVASPKFDGNDEVKKTLKNTPPLNYLLLQDEIHIILEIPVYEPLK